MKILFSVIIISLFAVATQFILPWWHIVPSAFLGAILVFQNHAVKSFVSGFIGIALFWGIFAGMLNNANDGILATRISTLLGAGGPFNLVIATAFVGGILGGFGAMTGDLFRQMITNKK
ncbi:MAG: hypothetical protein AAF502_06025 [Bacteroidota bacterium]